MMDKQEKQAVLKEYGKLIAETTSFHHTVVQMLVKALDSILSSHTEPEEGSDE